MFTLIPHTHLFVCVADIGVVAYDTLAESSEDAVRKFMQMIGEPASSWVAWSTKNKWVCIEVKVSFESVE